MISSGASSAIIGISGDIALAELKAYTSSADTCRNGLRTRLGERSGLLDRDTLEDRAFV